MRLASGAALLAALALTACGGGSDSGSSSTSSLTTVKQPQRETTAATTTEPTTSKAAKPPGKQRQLPTLQSPASPTATARLALTDESPLVCGLYTRPVLAKSFGGLAGCRRAVTSGGQADSVEIVSVRPEGRYALVVAVPHGGPSSAEKLTISLVRTGKNWRLDSIKSNVPVGP